MYKTIYSHLEKFRFSTSPLLKIENEIPKIQGSCSFIKYKDFHFILTAEHVLRGYENNLFLPREKDSNKLLKPGGESFLDYKNDIGIILLDNATIKLIKNFYIFFELDKKCSEESKNTKFSFIGFPESKGRFNKYKAKINVEPIIFTTEKASVETIKKINMHDEDKIFVMYNKVNVYNISEQKYRTGPDLYGISGCALIQHNENEFCIHSILTDWNQKNKNILIGTKISYINQILNYAVSKNCS